jgi:hypothetical protein
MSREIVRWVPPHERPEAVAERARKAKAVEVKDAEADARLAVAEARETHYRMMSTGRKFVLGQFEKWQRMSEGPDFENSIGPVEPSTLLKLAEVVSKDYRLSTGQATENIAHAVTPRIDFSKMSQAERDQWRTLAIKGGASEE